MGEGQLIRLSHTKPHTSGVAKVDSVVQTLLITFVIHITASLRGSFEILSPDKKK